MHPPQPTTITREEYRSYFGPTEGDGVRLADTDIVITVEHDYSRGRFGSGNEVVFGGGKVIRESMGQGPYSRDYKTVDKTADNSGGEHWHVPDTIITGALILDWWGIVKADVALRDGKIHAIGKAGNPLIMSDVGAASIKDVKTCTHDEQGDLVIGPETEVIAGNGKILTAGAIDTHVHLLLPGLATHALSGGITTLIGGGTGMASGSVATTTTPGFWNLQQMIKAMDGVPLNIGLLGKGSIRADGDFAEMRSQAEAGACGFKIHEDWGATPTSLRDTLKAADDLGVQVSLHSDTLNEAGYFQSTRQVIENSRRSIHSFHTEGAGGGHAPDILRMASLEQVLPASTNPTLPLTRNTTAEALWMVLLAHHLNPDVSTDRAFAESRVRAHTIFAENVLHDFGALSITSSDALAMGRISELVMRTWQAAHEMKRHWQGSGQKFPCKSETDGMDMSDDNNRAKRYVAKYTINPAVAQGIDKYVGSIEAGKYADLVLWDPRFFGVRAEMVLQGGVQVWAVCGDPTAGVTQPEPYWGRENWGSAGKAAASCTRMFVSPEALEDDERTRRHDPGTDKPWVAVTSTERTRKGNMKNNRTCPDIQVGVGREMGDVPEPYVVRINEKEYPAPEHPPESIPMTQRYSLF
ncbi:urease subunit alpha [Actinophytocola sp.]|uniref:urease subunit alpha n=1 Tax=Actinophytocola sp. TaxID=1872138 RepID=UPI00389A7832